MNTPGVIQDSFTRAAWLVWLTLVTAALNVRAVLTSVSPLLPLVRDTLGISNVDAGWLMAIPVLCMGVFAQFSVAVLRRFGLEHAIAGLLVLMGAAILTRWLWPTFAVLLASAAVSGACIAIIGPLLSGYVKKYLSASLTIGISVYSFSMVLGAATAAAVSGAMYAHDLASWPLILGMWGIPSVLAGMLWWGCRSAPLVTPAGTVATPATPALAMPWGNPVAWLLVAFFCLQSGLFYSLLAWFVPYLGERAGDYNQGIVQFGAFTFAQLGGSLVLPTLLEHLKIQHGEYVAGGLFTLGLSALLLPGSPWPGLLLVSTGSGAMFSYALLLPLRLTSNYAEGSAWSAMMLGAGYALSSAFPLGYGLLQDLTGRYRSIFVCLLLQAVLMCALLFWLNRLADARTAAR